MAKIRFESAGMGRGKLFVDGQQLTGVLSVRADLFATDSVPTLVVELMVDEFVMAPAPKDAEELRVLGLKPEDFA